MHKAKLSNSITAPDGSDWSMILSAVAEEMFEHLATLLLHTCEVPVALVVFTTMERQWCKSVLSSPPPQIMRDGPFYTYAIRQSDLFIIPDVSRVKQLRSEPCFTNSTHIRFFAGIPLRSRTGDILGILCVMDCIPRELQPHQQQALQALSSQMNTQIDLRLKVAELEQKIGQSALITEASLHQSDARFTSIFRANPAAFCIVTLAEGRCIDANDSYLDLLGYQRDELIGHMLPDRQLWTSPIDRKRLFALVRKDRSIRDIEVFFRTKSGELRDGLGSMVYIELEGQECMLAMLYDVTERRQHEREWKTFASVSTALRSTPNRAAMLPIILEQTQSLLNAEGAALVSYDMFRNGAMIECGSGKWIAYTGIHLSPAEEVDEPTMTVGQSYNHTNHQHDERLVSPAPVKNLHTVPYVPLMTKDQSTIQRSADKPTAYASTHVPPAERGNEPTMAVGQSYNQTNGQHDEHFVPPRLMNSLDAVAYVPLVAKNQTIGMLYVGRTNRFSDADLGVLAVIGDIAASAINRATLHEQTVQLYSQLDSRERFITRVLESIPSSLLVLDRRMRVVSANRNFLDKARREERTTLGRKISEIFPQALVQYTQLEQKMRAVFRTGQAVMGGKVAFRAPGLPTHIYYYRLIPLKRDEIVENVILFMDDITERERLEEEVRLAERHLASVVECANDLVVSLDREGRVLTWNRAAERVSGFKAEHIQGRSLLSLCPPDQGPLMAEMLHLLICGKDVQHIEINLLTNDSQEVPIAWSCSAMLSDIGNVIGIVAVGRDLTERRRLEAQLVQSAKMASLGVMAGGIAHELRNPLSIISTNAQLLLTHLGDARLHSECTQRIHGATKRASLIIENLLKFARPMSERMCAVDVNGVVKESFTLLNHQLSLQQVTLHQELQADLPNVHGNPALLQQVFTNLTLNACNAMNQGGVLTVITRVTPSGHVEIEFRDTGCGIAPDDISRIFDPFFTTMPVGKGTGLGLSISYSIIQQHNGTIEVTSQAGHGATFILCLPSMAEER